MPAPRLLEAIEKRLLARLEEYHGRVEARLRELVEGGRQPLEVLAAASVGDDRRPANVAAGMAKQLAERADHPRRQVVDAEVPRVLERRDRLGLSRARVPGDHDEVHRGFRV